MLRDASRWVIVVVAAACLVGMIIWARGPEHHHGRYVGALGQDRVSSAPVEA